MMTGRGSHAVHQPTSDLVVFWHAWSGATGHVPVMAPDTRASPFAHFHHYSNEIFSDGAFFLSGFVCSAAAADMDSGVMDVA